MNAPFHNFDGSLDNIDFFVSEVTGSSVCPDIADLLKREVVCEPNVPYVSAAT
jgi:hypothetical protein